MRLCCFTTHRLVLTPLIILFFAVFFSPVPVRSAETDTPAENAKETKKEDATQKEDATEKGAPARYQFDGYVSTLYVQRSAKLPDDSNTTELKAKDQDLFGTLRLDLTMPREKRYEFHFMGTARGDLDGNQDHTGYYPLEDIGDTGKNRWNGYLYEAHFDINYLFSALTQLRLGRQSGTRDEPIFFDGVAADVKMTRKLKMTAYGGYAVHYYELYYKEGSDKLGGVGFDYSPGTPTRISLDYLSTQDEREAPISNQNDQLVSLKLWQRLSDYWHGLIKLRYINGESRDVKLRSITGFPSAGVDVSVTYFRQLRTQNELANELAIYYDIVGQTRPFQSFDLKVRWQAAKDYALDVGYYKRQLLDEKADQGPFNRDFSRTFGVFEVDNLFFDGFSTSVTGERWQTATTNVDTGGFDLGYQRRIGKRMARVDLGTYYNFYKYNYYIELGERTQVRTYFLNGKMPLGDHFSVNGGYEYESGIDDFQRLKMGARYDF